MIIDAFIFFNEEELVKLRLSYLNQVIDKFVIIEADHTHQGKKKEWNFEKLLKNELKEFSDKINYHKLEIDVDKISKKEGWIFENVKGGKTWKIENYQRNYIREACKNFSGDDVVLISDLDEIPSVNKINLIKMSDQNKILPAGFEQFLFHLNCNYLNLEKWIGTIATTKKVIDKYEPQYLRNSRYKISTIAQAGWSFSSFGSTEKIHEKFDAFAHDEYNNKKFKSAEHIKNCKEKGADLFHRNIKKKKISKDFFPKDLLGLMEKNSEFYFN